MVQQANSCSASLCKGSFTHYLYTDTVDQLYALYCIIYAGLKKPSVNDGVLHDMCSGSIHDTSSNASRSLGCSRCCRADVVT